jgi:hypothetical protein
MSCVKVILSDVLSLYAFFDNDVFIEEGIQGKHITENDLYTAHDLRREVIKADAISFLLSLSDMKRTMRQKDWLTNYVVTPDRRVVIIDHDFHTSMGREGIENRKTMTCIDLDIDRAEYDRIFKEEQHLLAHRVKQYRSNISQLITLLDRSTVPKLRTLATDVAVQADILLREYL